MNKAYLNFCIYNICVLLLFIFLSVVFNHWWIVLFAGIFIMFPKYVHKYYRICDKCGKESEYADSKEEALEKAIKSGWIHIEESNKDYCLDCISKMEKTSNE